MSDYQNGQRPPEDVSEPRDGARNQDLPNDANTPPKDDASYQPPQQGYQPPQQGYQPPQNYPFPRGYPDPPPLPPSRQNPDYRHSEGSTAGKVFKIIGISLLIIVAVIAFALVGCLAMLGVW